jgi:hypothetical protein
MGLRSVSEMESPSPTVLALWWRSLPICGSGACSSIGWLHYWWVLYTEFCYVAPAQVSSHRFLWYFLMLLHFEVILGVSSHLYEFLSHFHRSLSPNMLSCFLVVVPISEVLSELHAKETRLCGVGLLEVLSLLTAREPTTPSAPPVSSHSSVSPLLPTSSDQGHSRPLITADTAIGMSP